jgi:hypothetical protein
VFAFDSTGDLIGRFGDETNHGPSPTDVVVDARGDMYFGDYEHFGPITKFAPNGSFIGNIQPREADRLDLASDQCRLYAQEANHMFVYVKNVCTGEVRHIWALGAGAESYGLRILPDGSLLVNHRAAIFRISDEGEFMRYYTASTDCDIDGSIEWPPGPDGSLDEPAVFSGLALGPRGTTFWSSCQVGGVWTPHEIDVATGELVRVLPVAGEVMRVKEGFRAAQVSANTCGEVRGDGRLATNTLTRFVFYNVSTSPKLQLRPARSRSPTAQPTRGSTSSPTRSHDS